MRVRMHLFNKIDDSEVKTQTVNLAAYSSCQKSVIWKYFGVEKNSSGAAERDRHVTCKLFAQKVAHGGDTTNLSEDQPSN